jgi:antitoxin CcdA
MLTQSRRRPVNLTIREDIMKEAKSLELNASKAAEAGIVKAIKKIQTEKWLAENKAAFKAHNERVSNNGTLLTPHWTDK